MSLPDAVKGDLRPALEALRDHIAKEMADGVRCKECHGTVSSPTAPLAKQLADVLKALAVLGDGKKGSVTDDLKAKRAARQAGVAKRAARSEQRRSRGDRASG